MQSGSDSSRGSPPFARTPQPARTRKLGPREESDCEAVLDIADEAVVAYARGWYHRLLLPRGRTHKGAAHATGCMCSAGSGSGRTRTNPKSDALVLSYALSCLYPAAPTCELPQSRKSWGKGRLLYRLLYRLCCRISVHHSRAPVYRTPNLNSPPIVRTIPVQPRQLLQCFHKTGVGTSEASGQNPVLPRSSA